MTSDEQEAASRLIDYWTPLTVRLCVDLGIFNAFGRSARSTSDVSAEVGCPREVLHRVVRALAGNGIFRRLDGDIYQLTELGFKFLSDSRDGIAGLASFRPWELHAWAEARVSLRSGATAFEEYYREPYFEWLAASDSSAKQFHDDMQRRSATLIQLGVPHYDWPEAGLLVDVGGGRGELIATVLERRPRVSATLFDTDQALRELVPQLAEPGLAARVRAEAGDFFVAVPSGGDLYVLASVLHDWDDDAAVRILRNCSRAMGDESRLLLFEYVISDSEDYSLAKMLDLHMLVVFGGRERSHEQWTDLLAEAGLVLTRLIPTPGLSWIEARNQRTEA